MNQPCPGARWAVTSRSWLLGALAAAAATTGAPAQDLEPRAYANAPVGLNFLIGGYAFSEGSVGTDPSIPIEDLEVEIHSIFLAYVRTLDLWGRSGKFDVVVPYSWASGSAELAGQPQEREVSGLNDPKLRLSMLFLGGPALSLDEFRDYKPDFIFGGSFDVTLPLGQYDSDKLFNLGTNRWSFKPELGISKTLGPVTLELNSGIRFYTKNDDFLDDKTLRIDPLYSVQGHLIYHPTPWLWAGFDALYYTGGQPSVDGDSAERLEDVRLGLTLALTLNRHLSVKLYGSTDVYTKTGTEFDILGIAWQFRWGGGL